MYFSTNSRYVLHRAQWMTPPAILRGAEKLLSVKLPNDDPSKPPLRVNIPKESSESRSNFLHHSSLKNFGEPRSKSLAARPKGPSLSANYKDSALPKSESEVQLTQLDTDDFLLEADIPETQTALQDYKVEAKTENDYHEGLRTSLHDAVVGESLATSNKTSDQTNAETKPALLEEAKPLAVEETKPQIQESDPRMICIIVDSPDESNKFPYKSVAETCKEESRTPTPLVEDDFATVKIAPHKTPSPHQQSKQKPTWSKHDNQPLKKSRSFSRVFRTEGIKKRFDVQEIDDLGTYVSHSRQNKDARKSFGVERVPEKEFTTRTSANGNDASIKVAGRSFKGLANEVTAIEELSDFVKIPDGKKKPKVRKSDNWVSKPKDITTNKNFYYPTALQSTPPSKSDVRDSEYMHSSADTENGKSVEKFVQDDFGGVRSAVKTTTYKIPEAMEQDTPAAVEAATESSEVQAEVAEQKPESSLIKMEGSSADVQSPSAESLSTWKEESIIDVQDTPQVQHAEWVTPISPERETFTAKTSENFPGQSGKRQWRKSASSVTSLEKVETPTSTTSFSKNEKTDLDTREFQTSGGFVSIGCEKVPSVPVKFSAAFPPLLCEALKIRGRILGFRREFLFSDKWTGKFDFNAISSKSSKSKVDLSENSILFPKGDTDKFDCCAFFGNKEEVPSKTPNNLEGEKSPKISDNIANVANENLTNTKGTTSIDSLAMMKKVKEIVEFDLGNAIKIFKKVEEPAETPSVMMLDGDKWKVDTEALEIYEKIRNENLTAFDDLDTAKLKEDISVDKINSEKIHEISPNEPKYLPSKKGSDYQIKLSDPSNSVISFNPHTNDFFVNKEALYEAVRRRADESFDDVIIQTLEGQLTRGSRNESFVIFDRKDGSMYQTQRGDSILVFDEETQSWKVDYTILEKREQQLRMEEELTKRSELILETFEKLEKNHISKIPKPDSKDKKIFDYNKKEWTRYPQENKSKEKVTKKFPFKESNAEEIRRNNSDLYENLFVGKKNEATMKKEKSDSSSDKETKSCSSKTMKAAESGSSRGSETTNEMPKQDSKFPPEEPKGDKPCEDKKEDSFWESFLKMNILPKDITEISQKQTPVPPPPPPPVPPPTLPPRSKLPWHLPKKEDPKPTVSSIKIDDPKPFIPPNKIEPEKKPEIPSKKIEEPKLRGFFIPFIGDKRIEESKIKDPPKEPSKIDDPTKKPPEPTIGGNKKQEPSIKAPSKESPKVEEPKSKPESTISSDIKQDSKIKAPPKEFSKIEDPKKKPPEAASSASGDAKKLPSAPSAHPMVDDPKSKKLPTTGATKYQNEKSAADHYVSNNIVEMSRNVLKDPPSKFKTNKIETVKLNIKSEKRMPSKVTEINLNKKCDEKGKESNTSLKKQDSVEIKKPNVPLHKNEKCTIENKSFYKKFEKYKTPFSDPEYEEKSMKIKSDIESNPNLKKLDNWNKTLVLHDIGKPPENIESWLKDETDKMATLLLKVLQEAADGKPRKKSSTVKLKLSDRPTVKANPFENPHKKLETNPENFLFRVRTVNLSLENDKKLKTAEERPTKSTAKQEVRGQQTKTAGRTFKVIDPPKVLPNEAQPPSNATNVKIERTPLCTDVQKTKLSPTALDSTECLQSSSVPKDLTYQNTLPMDITDEVPGPEFLKKMSNTWKMFPIIGSQLTIFTLLKAFQFVNLRNLFFTPSGEVKGKADAFSRFFTKYGPIVNVQGPFSGNVILIHKPEHLNSVFEQDSITPVRSVFDSLEQCRRENEDKVLSTSLAMDWSRPEWNDLRRKTNDPLLRSSERFFYPIEAAGDSLINSIRKARNLQNYVSDDFMEEIKRWSLEGLCSVMFDKSFGFLERKNINMNWIMEPDKLFMAIQEATNCLSKCEKGFQTWRLMSTPSSSGLTQAYRSLSTLIYKQLYQAEINLKNKSELIKERNPLISEDLTLLESMMLNDGLTMEDITCNLVDIMLIGSNLMSSALGFLLYDLANNVKVQSKLINELQKAFPSKDHRLNYNDIHSLKYLQACLKESLRMHIPVPIFYRMLQTDILLSNYVIPKGTYVVMDYRVDCKKEQFFDDPEKFLPERWLTEEKWIKDIHFFDNFPICHGPRADLAKKIVQMQLWTCAAKIVRNFGIEYHYGEIDGTNNLISLPDKPLKLNFVERDI